MKITRYGGQFKSEGSVTPTDLLEGRTCSEELCIGLSSGTATSSGPDNCTCQCHPHLPAFREDLSICVDDIHDVPIKRSLKGSNRAIALATQFDPFDLSSDWERPDLNNPLLAMHSAPNPVDYKENIDTIVSSFTTAQDRYRT
ncbi:unnamed protein product [Brassicogethes aeneus]|uniref:Shavenoid isoform B-like N-terminal domain-containing protein n=1 Tax=Brassicogethes aeneus TaxID=1431903 RepID=A0A9P0B0L3_BRAAE|nr:unnamed protein product [Brassicogethes aeneus]